jgi:aspartyl-tRNA(Asn)/glutamyl-tRNA(Gln) amidotransferase subunit A
MTDDILYSTITELGELLKARKISSLELTKAYLARLDKLGPRYNALACLIAKPAQAQAKEADDLFQRGRVRSPLQGIPYGAKDLLAVKGIPTTWGAAPYRSQVFDYDATVIQKLQKAGAVLAAKLAMVELAGGGGYRYPSASLFGPGKNPWNPEYWSGGSSSGSGAAVAAAMVPFAIGSETSGSILTPAAFCGVTGLRPTYGLVSRHGAMALAWTLDKIGPLCRSAEDCALVLRWISGRDSNDPGSSGKTFYYLADYGRPLSDLRIGYAPADFTDNADASARPAFQAALDVFRKLGPKMVEISLPAMPYGEVVSTIISAEGSTIFEPLIKSDRFDSLPDERQKAGLRAGLEIPAKDYLNAMRIRRIMQEKIRNLFAEVDVLLSVSRSGPAPGINEPLDRPNSPPAASAPKAGQKEATPKPAGNGALIAAGNLAGLPALSLPCGFSTGTNLPLGIQLAGRPFDELTLVTLGREFQKQTDWHRRRPPLGEV